jgi:hypothetical protein
MEFTRKEEPYSGMVIRTVENGQSYRVAIKFPDAPESLAICTFLPGTGWSPVRDLTEEEKEEYRKFVSAQEE